MVNSGKQVLPFHTWNRASKTGFCPGQHGSTAYAAHSFRKDSKDHQQHERGDVGHGLKGNMVLEDDQLLWVAVFNKDLVDII
jgi:hypothetical protein